MKINITEKAQEELKKILDKRKEVSKSVRIYLAGFGWGGPSFGLALDEQKDNDEVKEVEGFKILVDKDLTLSFNEFHIDYVNSWLRNGFQVYADGMSSSC